MTEFGFELNEIARLIEIVEERGLDKLIVEEDGRRIVIRGVRRTKARTASDSAFQDPHFAHSHPAAGPSKSVRAIPAGKRIKIESPMVGVFYRAAAPDAPPLVEVGDHIDEGHPIGMIEAMKVFSEIPSDYAGTVVEIIAKNGDLVRQGQALMYLNPD